MRLPTLPVVAATGMLVLVAMFAVVTELRTERAAANPLTAVSAVAASETNSCFLLQDGSVKCAGYNATSVPAPVPGLSSVSSIAGGGLMMCALSGGGVKCWTGTSAPSNVTGLTSGVSALSVNESYGCALTTAGAVKCWGSGQAVLADGVITSGGGSIAAGYQHACAVVTDGAVKCWGNNDQGQLGNGTTEGSGTPVDVQGLSGASAVAAGLNHSCALVSGGVLCWGHGYGTTPVAIGSLSSGLASISTSYLHTCAVLTGGGMKCWGSNVFGQLGDGLSCGGQCAVPTTPTGFASGGSQVSAGTFHSCAATSSGGASCWGINSYGQLGNGTMTNSTRPREVVTTMVKPPPTATSCPGGCPTATPTPEGPPLTGVDWSIAVDVNGDGESECTTEGTSADSCVVAAGSPFIVDFSLDALAPEVPAYTGFDFYMEYSGVQSQMNSFVVWPECDDPPTAYGSGWLAVGCNIFAGIYTSAYTGPMGGSGFTCNDSGSITLRHGSGHTDLIDQDIDAFYEGNPSSETLTIECIDPALDADGDGCPNGQELGPDPKVGGLRDPYNPWDYFDPTGDGVNRINDVIMVVQHYYQDAPEPEYTVATDRTPLGQPWRLGPPDGQQRLDDILANMGQYFHDCS